MILVYHTINVVLLRTVQLKTWYSSTCMSTELLGFVIVPIRYRFEYDGVRVVIRLTPARRGSIRCVSAKDENLHPTHIAY